MGAVLDETLNQSGMRLFLVPDYPYSEQALPRSHFPYYFQTKALRCIVCVVKFLVIFLP